VPEIPAGMDDVEVGKNSHLIEQFQQAVVSIFLNLKRMLFVGRMDQQD